MSLASSPAAAGALGLHAPDNIDEMTSSPTANLKGNSRNNVSHVVTLLPVVVDACRQTYPMARATRHRFGNLQPFVPVFPPPNLWPVTFDRAALMG